MARIKRLTRQQKVDLQELTDEFRDAGQIGVSTKNLDALVAHGLARAVLDCGEMRYRITEQGHAMIYEREDA